MPLNTSDTVDMSPLHTTQIIAALLSALVLLGIGTWAYFNKFPLKTAAEEKHSDFYSSLVSASPSYAQAEQFAAQGRFANALPQYQAAISQAKNAEEREQIQLLTARAMVQTGSYADAATLLKNIVAMPVAPRTARGHATAAAEIAEIASRGVPEVNRSIFTGEPFAPLWAGNNYALTLRHLYEYAASFYPIALAELRVADWYARQFPKKGATTKLSADTLAEYKSKIQTLFAAADQDIAYLRADGTMTYDLRYALLLRATVLGTLARKGDTSLGDADAQFTEAIRAYADVGPGHDCRPRYAYALFMSQSSGIARKADIHAVLKPLSGDAYTETNGCAFLKEARTSSYARPLVSLVAHIDPDFKTYLMTLGWVAADFSS